MPGLRWNYETNEYEKVEVPARPLATWEREEWLNEKGAYIEGTERETILDEAKEAVYGDREDDYGHPSDHFGLTASYWSTLLGVEVEAWQVPVMFMLDKVSRLAQTRKRDTIIDIAGYAAALARQVGQDE